MARTATDLVHGTPLDAQGAAPLTTPIYETTTFLFESAAELQAYNEGRSAKYIYSRYGNPTVAAVERTLAGLDGADAALVFSSGNAATATILAALLEAGGEVVCSAAVYGGTLHLMDDLFARFGVKVRFVSLAELEHPADALTADTKLLWFESPVNPTLRLVDVRRVADACRARGVVSVLDNTFATPLNQRPLALGVDLAMQSATKYLNGHSDVTSGAVSGPAELVASIERVRRLLGTVLDPAAAYGLGRGVKTLGVRMARHNATAGAVAEWLAADRRVSAVCYPGLPSSPDHELACRQMLGFGGMVSFDLAGDFTRAAQVYDRLRVIRRAASLGGVESLVSLPVLTSHWGCSDDQLARAGISKGMVRLSIGLEDPADLITDLDQALGG